MANKNNILLYDGNLMQGISIVKGNPAGHKRPYAPVYYTPFPQIFDSAVKKGEVFDCPIVNYF
jgi:hypothetical protein